MTTSVGRLEVRLLFNSDCARVSHQVSRVAQYASPSPPRLLYAKRTCRLLLLSIQYVLAIRRAHCVVHRRPLTAAVVRVVCRMICMPSCPC